MAADSIARVSVNRGVEAVEVPTVCDYDFAPLISNLLSPWAGSRQHGCSRDGEGTRTQFKD
jgi:hypothetical protein